MNLLQHFIVDMQLDHNLIIPQHFCLNYNKWGCWPQFDGWGLIDGKMFHCFFSLSSCWEPWELICSNAWGHSTIQSAISDFSPSKELNKFSSFTTCRIIKIESYEFIDVRSQFEVHVKDKWACLLPTWWESLNEHLF